MNGSAGVVAKALPADAGRDQRARPQVQLPDAELPSLCGEPQPGLALLLRTQAIAQLGEQRRVLGLQPGQPLALQRHVHLAGKEIGEFARRIPHRGQQQPVPEPLATLAVVEDVDLDRLDRGHGGPDAPDRARVRVRPLEEAAVAAEDVFPRIARQAAERIVGKHHGVIGLARVGDDHRHARGPHGGHERVGATAQPKQFGADPCGVGLCGGLPCLPFAAGLPHHGPAPPTGQASSGLGQTVSA